MDNISHNNYTPLRPPLSKFKLLFPIFILVIFLSVLLAVLMFYMHAKIQKKPQNIMCTMEAKVCANGTSVGRVPPKCDFAPCKEIKTTPTPMPIILNDYINENILLSFKYPRENDLSVTEPDANFNFTPLKSDKDLVLGYMNSDTKIMGIYYWKSDLSERDWWNSIGHDMYNELVFLSHNAGSPTEKPYKRPEFKMSESTIGGKKALVAKGFIEIPNGGGETIISIVSYKGGIYVFNQVVDALLEKKALDISSQALSTLQFLPKNETSNNSEKK